MADSRRGGGATWRGSLPSVRGRLLFDEPLAPFTWFRVGGPAEALFLPADEDDLAVFLRGLPRETPITVLGAASNLIVRDGGVDGVVIRLGRAFADIAIEPHECRATVGAAALDGAVARAAGNAGLAGLEFYAGIPGTIGGALTMNAGCYGVETSGRLMAARGIDRGGERRVLPAEALGHAYRRSDAPGDIIWTQATLRGHGDDPGAIVERMTAIAGRREATQPIREKTGGSTFKNPTGDSAWRLIDAAGWRGRLLGGAMFSPLHANFMINTGDAKAADLEYLGEAVRADVRAKFDIDLEWEIRRIGRP